MKVNKNKLLQILTEETANAVEEVCAAAAPYPMKTVMLKKPSMPNGHQGTEARMHRTNLAHIVSDASQLLDMIEDDDDLPEWLETKITKAADYLNSASRYISGNIAREENLLEDLD